MICKTKTISRAGGDYEAPFCKVYSITVESVIAGSPDSADDGYDGGHSLGDI